MATVPVLSDAAASPEARAVAEDIRAVRGMRLDIAGFAVRFEPVQRRAVALIRHRGERAVHGFNQAVVGPL